MLEIIIKAVVILGAAFTLLCYAACVVSSKCSRQEEKQHEQQHN